MPNNQEVAATADRGQLSGMRKKLAKNPFQGKKKSIRIKTHLIISKNIYF